MNTEKVEQEERDAAEAIMWGLWDEWTTEIAESVEPQEEKEAIQLLAQTTGATIKSPLAFLFRGFRAGVGKGLELADRIEKASI